MADFGEFINQRREKIRAQIRRLQDDLTELNRAEKLFRASLAEGGATTSSPPQTESQALPLGEPEPPEDATIKERVLIALSTVSTGMTSSQLLAQLQARGLATLARTSLSPQLSRLRTAGLVQLENGLWSLTAEGRDAAIASLLG